MKWFIGCSGFQYRHWKPGFYPKALPQRLWFEYYNQHFNSLELNTTFYSFPKIEVVKKWYLRSPNDFVFTVKAPRIITHYKKFVDVKSLMKDFYNVVSSGLREKLGSCLFQLPPNLHYSPEKLTQIISALDKNFINVIEFRDESWWNEKVYNCLLKNKIVFCSINHPTLPGDIITDSSMAYIRMHGKPRLYTTEYKTKTLQNIIDQVKSSKKIKTVFIYFNNDSIGAAYRNAEQMMKMLNISRRGAEFAKNLFD
jgi:uncharacterized protein YecE (DUF72 family)